MAIVVSRPPGPSRLSFEGRANSVFRVGDRSYQQSLCFQVCILIFCLQELPSHLSPRCLCFNLFQRGIRLLRASARDCDVSPKLGQSHRRFLAQTSVSTCDDCRLGVKEACNGGSLMRTYKKHSKDTAELARRTVSSRSTVSLIISRLACVQ